MKTLLEGGNQGEGTNILSIKTGQHKSHPFFSEPQVIHCHTVVFHLEELYRVCLVQAKQ